MDKTNENLKLSKRRRAINAPLTVRNHPFALNPLENFHIHAFALPPLLFFLPIILYRRFPSPFFFEKVQKRNASQLSISD